MEKLELVFIIIEAIFIVIETILQIFQIISSNKLKKEIEKMIYNVENKNCKSKEDCDCEKRGCIGCYYNKDELFNNNKYNRKTCKNCDEKIFCAGECEKTI